ncbi:hemicentin-2-like isoform X1 [Pecten maximus]|uniref:hemicentin-2-like isoform X1 n=1 Tax=Pecten maximus TaxID=6579 RepID=UPI001458232C|nr:hemicentin-2-like isoform X1 [Pecten maximus]
MNRLSAFASIVTAMMACIGTSIDAKIRFPDHSGFDCEGEVGKGTVAHQVRFPNGTVEVFCCYPRNCTGGTLKFCKKDMENDTCVPCQDGCNYHVITSHNLFHMEKFCKDPCKYAIPVVHFFATQYTKQRGDTVTLQPKIYSDYTLQGLCWKREHSSGSYDLAGCNSTDFDTRKYEVGHSQDPFLTIKDLNLSDQGVYQLSVWNENGVSIVCNVTLNITARPIVVMQKTVYVDEGSVHTIRCFVKEIPEPNYVNMTFRGKDGQKSEKFNINIQPDGEVTHIIQKVSTKDSGYYTCSAENTAGSGENTQQLIVYTRPQISSPEDGKILTCDAGEYISTSVSVTSNLNPSNFSCHQLNGNSKLSCNITHRKDNLVTFNVSIQNIQLSNTGRYMCMASNRLGTNNITIDIIVERTEPRVPVTNANEGNMILVWVITAVAVIFVVGILIWRCHKRRAGNDRNATGGTSDADRQSERGGEVQMGLLPANGEH